jgi:SAM-dependent methyltransferase
LPDAAVDIIFSNSVLEHIAADLLPAMMQESRRVLRPGGLAIHSANCGDHYAYFDRHITPINYLTYTADQWRFWNNRLLHQNRLRPQDFIEAAEAAGLDVVLRKFKPRPDLLEALPRLNIAPEFLAYPPEQLCTTSVDFVAQRNPRLFG